MARRDNRKVSKGSGDDNGKCPEGGQPLDDTAKVPGRGSIESECAEEEWLAGRRTIENDSAPVAVQIDAFCPFCFAPAVVNPVALHSACGCRNRSGGVDDDEGGDGAKLCVACQDCASQWMALLSSSGKPLQCPVCANCEPTTAKGVLQAADVAAMGGVRNRVPDGAGGGGGGCYPTSSSNSLCGVCEKGSSGPLRLCLQCQFPICAACESVTHAKGRFTMHELVPMSSARLHASRKCASHSGQPVELYCHDCQQAICVTCCFGGVGAHRGHDVVPLKEIAEETAGAIRCMVAGLQATASEAQSVQGALAQMGPVLQRAVAEVEREVTETFSALREALTHRESTLLAELHSGALEMRGCLEGHLARVSAVSDALLATTRQCEAATKDMDPATLMAMAPEMRQRYAALQEIAVEQTSQSRHAQWETEKRLGTAMYPSSDCECTVASFHLLTKREDNASALTEYSHLLGTLGAVQVHAQLSEPTDTPMEGRTPDTTTGPGVVEAELESEYGTVVSAREVGAGGTWLLPSQATTRHPDAPWGNHPLLCTALRPASSISVRHSAPGLTLNVEPEFRRTEVHHIANYTEQHNAQPLQTSPWKLGRAASLQFRASSPHKSSATLGWSTTSSVLAAPSLTGVEALTASGAVPALKRARGDSDGVTAPTGAPSLDLQLRI